jgi:hypothetical protein
MIPVLSRLEKARRVLIAGCGGGFDVFAGIPIARHLIDTGREVVFANLSFTNLWACGGERLTPITWRVDRQSNELPYFPERLLGEWLSARGIAAPVYALAKAGARPLATAYRLIMERPAHSVTRGTGAGTRHGHT